MFIYNSLANHTTSWFNHIPASASGSVVLPSAVPFFSVSAVSVVLGFVRWRWRLPLILFFQKRKGAKGEGQPTKTKGRRDRPKTQVVWAWPTRQLGGE